MVYNGKKNYFQGMIWEEKPMIFGNTHYYGCFLKWWVLPPISHPKCWSFLVGKPIVVGETHRFGKHPIHFKRALELTELITAKFPEILDLPFLHKRHFYGMEKRWNCCFFHPESYRSFWKKHILTTTSWWLNQPSSKICSSKWVHLPKVRGENRKYLKPPSLIFIS